MRRTVIIIDDNTGDRNSIAEIMDCIGFEVLAEFESSSDISILCRQYRPDAVLLGVNSPDKGFLDALPTIIDENLAGCVVMLDSLEDEDLAELARQAGVTGRLVKPVDGQALTRVIDTAIAQGVRYREVRSHNEMIRRKLEIRGRVDQARELLSRRDGISRDEASEVIRALSNEQGKSMVEIARAIISSAEREGWACE